MNLLEKIIVAYSGSNLPRQSDTDVRNRLKKAVASRAHGNIRIQLARFYTRKDAERRYEQAQKIKFKH